VSKAGVEQLGRALRVELAPTGATAGVAYFGFIDTDMVSTAFAQPAATAMRAALPGFISQPITVDIAVDKLVTNIEHRAACTTAPRWVPLALLARGPLAALDAALTHNPCIHRAITVAATTTHT
jgi:NAD(P)-dependent dehydrogenase (short-subunit alcohol dehydrogenase family)